jgi:hypothetical protein
MKKRQEQEDLDSSLSDGTRLAPYLVAERTTLRYERFAKYLARNGTLVVGSASAACQYRLLPDHPARPEVPEGRLASVLLDSSDRLEIGASLIAEKKTSYLCTLLIVPPPDSALKMRNQ